MAVYRQTGNLTGNLTIPEVDDPEVYEEREVYEDEERRETRNVIEDHKLARAMEAIGEYAIVPATHARIARTPRDGLGESEIESLPRSLRQYFVDQRQLEVLVGEMDRLHTEIKRTLREQDSGLYALMSRGVRGLARILNGQQPPSLEHLFLKQRENSHGLITFGRHCIYRLGEREQELEVQQYAQIDKSRQLHEGYRSVEKIPALLDERERLRETLKQTEPESGKYHEARMRVAQIGMQLRRLRRAERLIMDEAKYIERDLPDIEQQLDLISTALDMTAKVVQNATHVNTTVDRVVTDRMAIATSMALVRRLDGEVRAMDLEIAGMQSSLRFGLERMMTIIER